MLLVASLARCIDLRLDKGAVGPIFAYARECLSRSYIVDQEDVSYPPNVVLEADEAAFGAEEEGSGGKKRFNSRIFIGATQRGNPESLYLHNCGFSGSKKEKRFPKIPGNVWQECWEFHIKPKTQ